MPPKPTQQLIYTSSLWVRHTCTHSLALKTLCSLKDLLYCTVGIVHYFQVIFQNTLYLNENLTTNYNQTLTFQTGKSLNLLFSKKKKVLPFRTLTRQSAIFSEVFVSYPYSWKYVFILMCDQLFFCPDIFWVLDKET